MADVKIRIEVNPNAESAVLGDIQNQVNDTASSENLSNVSVKTDSIGVFQNIPSSSGGVNGLSLAQDLVFDENGYLDNADLKGAVLESAENPVEFVWGIVPESGEYSVKLIFTNAQNLKNIVIYGDSVVNQFPIQAIVDGAVIYNDDLEWAISLQGEASTHTIEFTHWNKVNYNACLSYISVMMKYLDIDKYNGLKNIESLNQSSSDASGIYYGILENSGSLEIFDGSGELGDLLADGVIDNSNTKVEIIANGKSVQHHISTDSSYNRNTQIVSVELGNRLNSLDVLKYKGYSYPDHSENLANLLFDVLSNLRYALFGKDKELTETEFKQMLSEKHDYEMTLYDYLYSIDVQYPVIEANKTYREVIDEFCLIAQMQMFIDDDNNVKFVSARPKVFDKDFTPIHIPKKNMFSQLDRSVILKNKYDGVEASKTIVNDVIDYSTALTQIDLTIPNTDKLQTYVYEPSKFEYSGNYSALAYMKVEAMYYTGDVTVNKTSNDNLEKILEVFDDIIRNEQYTYNNYYDLYTAPVTAVGKLGRPSVVGNTASVSNVVINDSEGVNDNNKTSTLDIDEECEITVNISDDESITATSAMKDNRSKINSIVDNGSSYTINYTILVGKSVMKLTGQGSGISDENVSMSGTYEKYTPKTASISLYGNKRIISFEQLQSNTENIELAKTKVSIGSSNLIQDDAVINQIKGNILSDYILGVSNASVSISCNDYFDSNGEKVIDWARGEVPQVNQIVYFDNDVYKDQSQRYWKIKGRNFRKTGVAMVDLELEELINKPLEEYSWEQINLISSTGIASSIFKLGDTKSFTLSTGETLFAQIAAFNYEEKADGTGKTGITFVLKSPTSTSYPLYEEYPYSWLTCSMRNVTLPLIYSQMASVLRNTIKEVKRSYFDDASGAVQYYTDKVYLPAYDHVFNGYYPYFKNIENRKKGAEWWLGSMKTEGKVTESGEYSKAYISESLPICFAFCI